jgi:hypothetical protein
MHRIRERFGADLYYFIDDSVKNLKQLDADINPGRKVIALMFAAWGYTGPDDHKLAESHGYPVFHQKDLVSFMRKIAKSKN